MSSVVIVAFGKAAAEASVMVYGEALTIKHILGGKSTPPARNHFKKPNCVLEMILDTDTLNGSLEELR